MTATVNFQRSCDCNFKSAAVLLLQTASLNASELQGVQYLQLGREKCFSWPWLSAWGRLSPAPFPAKGTKQLLLAKGILAPSWGWIPILGPDPYPTAFRNHPEPRPRPAAAVAGAMSSLLSLQEENRILQQELSRVEDLLAQSRAERDELAIKYNAISERVSRQVG